VTVTPSSPTTTPGGIVNFTATVTGAAGGVIWRTENNGGAITTAGKFTAPSQSGTYRVIAISAADRGVQGVATVTIP